MGLSCWKHSAGFLSVYEQVALGLTLIFDFLKGRMICIVVPIQWIIGSLLPTKETCGSSFRIADPIVSQRILLVIPA
jgi:hypothetical protein